MPRHPLATTVLIDPVRLRRFFWLRRTPLSHVGPMVGKSGALLSVLAYKGHMSFWTADAIATEFGLHVDQFLREVGSEEELERIGIA